MKVVVAQKGTREHFLVPRALHRHGCLTKLLVDWYAPSNSFLRKLVSLALRSKSAAVLGARADGIPDCLVDAKRLNGLWGKWKQTISPWRKPPYEQALDVDTAFTKAVARSRLPPHDVFFGYSYMSLEMLQAERARNVLTVLDQIDPGPVEFRLVAGEMKKRPDLAGQPLPYPGAYYSRLKKEWELADVIIVNSEWTREAIIAEGAAPTKIEILPLAYEPAASQVSGFRFALSSPLRVLWLGQVNVRKGIHYLIEAAQILQGEPVTFSIAGPIQISQEVVNKAPANIRWLGAVPRASAASVYRQNDLFVLPTLSDGFAITQLEALAYGLPIIVTPNCGRVVKDGETGFLVPAGNGSALAEAILRFLRNPNLLPEMRVNARASNANFSIDAYADLLICILKKHLAY